MRERLGKIFFERDNNLNDKMIRFTIVAGAFLNVVGTLSNFLIMDFLTALVPALIQMTAMIVALVATFKYHKEDLAAMILGFVITVKGFPDMFYLSGGIEGGATIWFVLILVYNFMVFSGKKLAFFVCLTLVVDAVVYARTYHNPQLVTSLNTRWAVYFDSFVAIVAVGLVIGGLLKLQMKLYDMERCVAREQREEIERISNSKNEFFSNMSHEIRTPINTILGMNEMILRESNETQTKEYAQHIERASKVLLGLVNDVLDLSQMEIGQLEIVPVEYETEKMIREVAQVVEASATEKRLNFILDIDDALPSVLQGDERRIKQVLWNLLSNAVKYTKEGSVTLSVEGEIKSKDELILKLTIADTGQGIKREDFGKLFDTFERVEEWKKSKVEGIGLGLAIVKHLLELMEGEITVDSIYTKGSTFTVTMPQKIVNEEPIGAQVPAVETRGSYQPWFEAPEAQVLIVDDNNMDRIVLSRLLKATKMHVDVASSGAECLLRAKKKAYDMILLDYFMPEMDGGETITRLRRQENGLCRESEVIVLTTRTLTEVKELCKKYGFDGYLDKPIIAEKLEKEILRCLPQDMIEYRRDMADEKKMHAQGGVRRRKKRVCITSDCICDLPEDLIRKYDIPMMYLYVVTNQGRFADTREIDSDNLVQILREEDSFVRLDNVTVEEYEEFFARELTHAEEIIHISMARSAGPVYKAAEAAAKGFGHVHVIDSGHISGGEGLVVLYAAKMAQEGYDVQSICAEIDHMKNEVSNKFLLPTCKYFYQNGFTNAPTAKICEIFRLYPVLLAHDGKLTIVGVRTGLLENAWRRFIRYHLRKKRRVNKDIVIITHVGCTVKQLEIVREEVVRCIPFDRVIIQKASLSNGCNSGIGSIGIAYYQNR